jgi:hypothetical protein
MAYGNALGEAGLEREAVACFLALQEMDRTDPLGARFETLKYVRDPETGEPLPPPSGWKRGPAHGAAT